MGFIRNMEGFFEKYIEGFFNKQFSSGLQPVEIGKYLIREMDKAKSVGISQIYIPNKYLVYINHEDFERIQPYSQAVCDELSAYLRDKADEKDYNSIGKISVAFQLDESLEKAEFRVSGLFTEPLPGTESQETSNTMVFTKISHEQQEQALVTGNLTVIEGLDAGLKITLSSNRVNIGRRESNELPLSDMNTSRLQAHIQYIDGDHILHDAKSLNGTYVNGQRITRKRLQSGDHIKMGNTTILYEVK